MSTSDGYLGATHKIVDHGLETQRFNVVILGDGYRASELTKFGEDVDAFVEKLRSAAPFNELWCAVNVFRIDVVSTDSGADDPGTCADGSSGSGATPRTYFDATFCGGGEVRRLLTCDSGSAISVAKSRVPKMHVTMVIVSVHGNARIDLAGFHRIAAADKDDRYR